MRRLRDLASVAPGGLAASDSRGALSWPADAPRSDANNAQTGGTLHACARHPEVREWQAGICPKCGERLQPRTPRPDVPVVAAMRGRAAAVLHASVARTAAPTHRQPGSPVT